MGATSKCCPYLASDGHLDSGHVWSHDVCRGERRVDDITDVAWGMGLGMLPAVDVAFGIGMDTVEAMVNHKLVAFVVVWLACAVACLVSFACEEQSGLGGSVGYFAAVHTTCGWTCSPRMEPTSPTHSTGPFCIHRCMCFIPWQHWSWRHRGFGSRSRARNAGVGLDDGH